MTRSLNALQKFLLLICKKANQAKWKSSRSYFCFGIFNHNVRIYVCIYDNEYVYCARVYVEHRKLNVIKGIQRCIISGIYENKIISIIIAYSKQHHH